MFIKFFFEVTTNDFFLSPLHHLVLPSVSASSASFEKLSSSVPYLPPLWGHLYLFPPGTSQCDKGNSCKLCEIALRVVTVLGIVTSLHTVYSPMSTICSSTKLLCSVDLNMLDD